MQHLHDPLFQTIFNQLDQPVIILKNDAPDFSIVSLNLAYQQVTGMPAPELKGKSFWEFFKSDGASGNAAELFLAGLHKSLDGNQKVNLPVFRFGLGPGHGGKKEVQWWQVEIRPVTGIAGAVDYLMCTTKNVTIKVEDDEVIRLSQQNQAAMLLIQKQSDDDLNEARTDLEKSRQELKDKLSMQELNFQQRSAFLSDSEYRLNRVVMTTPIGLAILKGAKFIVELANRPILKIWGRGLQDVQGQELLSLFPELEDQPFPELLREVYRSGQSLAVPEIPVVLVLPDRSTKHITVNFSYSPLFDLQNNVEGILVSVMDVTATTEIKVNLQSRQEQLEAMNEELKAMNEELQSLNEEINTGNEQLGAANEELQVSNEELAEIQKEQTMLYHRLKDALQDQQMAQQEFQQAISTADLGHWSIDMTTLELRMSAKLRDIFGLPLEGPVSVEAAMEAIEPEYRDLVTKVLNQGLQENKSCDFEYPLRHLQNKELIWVRATGSMFFDRHGHPAQFAGVFMDITERKKDEQRKNDFIGIVSHEMKTPLTSLKGFLQVINLKALKDGQPMYTSMSAKALSQIDKMETLVRGFLDVAKIGSGKIHLEMQSFYLDEVLKESIEENQILSDQHELIYEPCDSAKLYADKNKIAQVMNNLISNAVKYSPLGRRVVITCNKQKDQVQVSVRDEGMGIRQQDMDKLFDRFYRIENKSTATISGFGIGLYLCAEIIERHDGKIWVESEPDKGTTFYFSLPLAV